MYCKEFYQRKASGDKIDGLKSFICILLSIMRILSTNMPVQTQSFSFIEGEPYFRPLLLLMPCFFILQHFLLGFFYGLIYVLLFLWHKSGEACGYGHWHWA